MKKIYHNELDKNCCKLLNSRFPESIIDERSIEDVKPEELKGYKENHLFAGIGGFSLGFKRAGNTSGTVLTAGFPCQDLSVAGKRKGLAGERSGLYFKLNEIITGTYPDTVLLENVPGLLSSHAGKDFAIVIGGLTGIIPEIPESGWGNAGFFRGPVYSVAYRVLDAQFFGVAQRRRRVFIVGSLGSGRAAEILFEPESGERDTPPSREAGEGTPAYAVRRANTSSNGWGIDEERIHTLDNSGGDMIAFNHQSGRDFRPQPNENKANALQVNQGQAVAFQQSTFGALQARDGKGIGTTIDDKIVLEMSHADEAVRESGDISPTLQKRMGTGGNQVPMVRIRRLTPLEAERLQGFPDGWTEGFSDSARYRMLGNAVAVPVIEWMARQIIASECF